MNPYTPPDTLVTEATPPGYWHCIGGRVMARDGAVLPKVDLETGTSEGEMMAVARHSKPPNQFLLLYFIFVILFIFDFAINIIAVIFGFYLLIRTLLYLQGKRIRSITIMEFREFSRHQAFLKHVRRRQSIYYLNFVIFITGMMFRDEIIPSFPILPLILFSTFWVTMIIICIWTWTKRPRSSTESAPLRGWLRIRDVHPEAMRKLREIEAAEQAARAFLPPDHQRLVFTSYLHRLPLAVLIGNRKRNPIRTAKIILLKLLRSAKLERESFHFDETFEITAAEISPTLHTSVEAWRLGHPDWQLLKIERHPSPAGDLTVDTAILVSPQLEHILYLSHATSPQHTPLHSECGFITYLQPSHRIHTSSMPIIPIRRTEVDSAQAEGSHLQIFETHLSRCAQHALAPAADLPSLLAHLHHEKAETHTLLEAAGHQSPIREVPF